MATTQLALLFIGALATAATVGFFYRFGDRLTALLVELAAPILWGLFALSSMDVIVRDAAWASASEPVTPLVWVGIGFAVATFLLWLYDLFEGGSEAAMETDLGVVR